MKDFNLTNIILGHVNSPLYNENVFGFLLNKLIEIFIQ